MPRHAIAECDRRLRALSNYDIFRCRPPEFVCSCGRRWAHVCDEAEGCSYRLVGEGATGRSADPVVLDEAPPDPHSRPRPRP